MLAQEKRRILDEHPVRIVGEIGQSDHFEPRIVQGALIGMMLPARLGMVDRGALLMGQRAVR